MDLQIAVDLSQIAAAVTVVGGTIFGLLQFREYRQQRQETIVLELLNQFMGSEFSAAMVLITSLPEEVSADDLRNAGPEVERAANQLCTVFESIGLLVHRRIAPFPLVQDLMGGVVPVAWRRLRPWVLRFREQTQNTSDSEWFQWLAEQLERHAGRKSPAYQVHRGWEP